MSAANNSSFSSHRASTFSQACSHLSQYLREKRRSCYADDTNFIISSIPSRNNNNNSLSIMDEDGLTTMNLFPQEAGSHGMNNSTSSSAAAQMTIFYGGQVVVLEGLPAEKAIQIMQLASCGRAGSSLMCAPEAAIGKVMIKASDLPIARKGSLQRFFEKRKDRISSRPAPYNLNHDHRGGDGGSQWTGITKGSAERYDDDERRPWLSLAPRAPAWWSLQPELSRI